MHAYLLPRSAAFFTSIHVRRFKSDRSFRCVHFVSAFNITWFGAFGVYRSFSMTSVELESTFFPLLLVSSLSHVSSFHASLVWNLYSCDSFDLNLILYYNIFFVSMNIPNKLMNSSRLISFSTLHPIASDIAAPEVRSLARERRNHIYTRGVS